MIFDKTSNLHLWRYGLLSQNKEISHFVTGKRYFNNYVSDHFTLGKNSGNEVKANNNRQILAGHLRIELSALHFPFQTHSNNVAVLHKAHEIDLSDTDAIITQERNVCIGVLAADCVPILLYDAQTAVIGAVHAGWRGTTGKILTKTLELMHSTFGTKCQNVKVAIGPSICPEVYEVGQEVVIAANKAFGRSAEGLFYQSDKKIFFNLWKANIIQALLLGVPEQSIEVAQICTFKNSELFFSARKEGFSTGRFASCIMLH